MLGDVLDPLAVDVDLPAVAERVQIFGTGEWPLLVGADVFGIAGHVIDSGQLAQPNRCLPIIIPVARAESDRF